MHTGQCEMLGPFWCCMTRGPEGGEGRGTVLVRGRYAGAGSHISGQEEVWVWAPELVVWSTDPPATKPTEQVNGGDRRLQSGVDCHL